MTYFRIALAALAMELTGVLAYDLNAGLGAMTVGAFGLICILLMGGKDD